MTTLVLGDTGATGRLLVEQLLQRGHAVKAMARSPDRLPEPVRNHERLSVIHASVLDLDDAQLVEHVTDCQAVASCLGHNLTWKGVFGSPRRLVTDATRRVCEVVKATDPQTPVRFVLMNSAGNRNRDLNERVSLGQRCVIGLFRLLLPPHADNEHAADYLRTELGRRDEGIEWVAVRPDSLIDEEAVSRYEVHPSPTRSAIFNPGSISRINVAHFMAELIADDPTWRRWVGRMPVIYNRDE